MLEGSLFGFETGLTYVRHVRLDGDVLTLTTVDLRKRLNNHEVDGNARL